MSCSYISTKPDCLFVWPVPNGPQIGPGLGGWGPAAFKCNKPIQTGFAKVFSIQNFLHPHLGASFSSSMLLNILASYCCLLNTGLVWFGRNMCRQTRVPHRRRCAIALREVKNSSEILSFLESGAPTASLMWARSCQCASSDSSLVDANGNINLIMVNRTLGVDHVVLFAWTTSQFCRLCLSAVRQRDEWDRRRKLKVKRERGWTGNSWGGISLGPPDPGPNGGKHSVKTLNNVRVCHTGWCSITSVFEAGMNEH